jgi:DNA-binding CsgD family transcriptional regulator
MTSLVGRGKPQRLFRKDPEASPQRSRPDRPSPDASDGWKRHLDFLGAFGQLAIRSGHSLEQMLEGLVRLLPCAWRYPEICCARAILHGQVFATPNYRESPWMLEGEIGVQGAPVCKLQVAYLAACPEADNGPFTHEERALLSFVATLLSKTVERLEAIQRLRETVEQLDLERGALQQANGALCAVLGRIDEERKATHRTIAASADKLVMPVVHALEAQVPPQIKPMVALLKTRLEEIASPFADNLSRTFASLTPLEISMCRMIRDNLTTKEIARIRHVSPSTVARQREQIRRKLGIANSDANLATYLRTFLPDREQSLAHA